MNSLLATSEVPPPVGGVRYSGAIAPILIVCAIVWFGVKWIAGRNRQ